ncbi:MULTISPECIES: biotin-dependent carboxyltransferase family protein [Fusobacterium]|uniref:5-oxoprolinase subunit C family protein n=1 Tax=Fusobacterium TaxID=848 RepID=UPI001F1F5D6F|nr:MULTISPECIES: biotin-dependent carboxyltransferase family protein [Fusobacterium]MCF2612490.1 biotin-dependent carboxyltransferase [Fusobacterium perfoetens]MDY2980598.1 biotin-dependent carboxyltransferase family protein [Fusobacterium sp.]
METIKILDAGLLTTVQDLGRYGFQRYGVSASGVMDEYSAKIANKLVGNKVGEAVLETTLKGVQIEFLQNTAVAITGGNCDVTLNGAKIELWQSYLVNRGDILKMGICRSGLRNYLAFAGGIDVPIIMNSKSTNLKAKVGGFNGRKLMTGDVLSVGVGSLEAPLTLNKHYIPTYSKDIKVGVILGQQDDHFTEAGIKTFLNETYTVTQESDRMGIRLSSVSGATIEHKNGADIISDGITFGAIQVPGSGQPIVMMADRQTTGGYTKIGNVISSDLAKLAQATPGTKVKFVEYTLEQAVQAIKNNDIIINNQNSYISPVKEEVVDSSSRDYRIKINNKIFELKVERIR